MAKSLGVPDKAVRDNLQGVMGDSGAAHALVILAQSLQEAGPGENILVVGWGQGVDALLFRTTKKICQCHPLMGISGV